jgi:hypothetical protein
MTVKIRQIFINMTVMKRQTFKNINVIERIKKYLKKKYLNAIVKVNK